MKCSKCGGVAVLNMRQHRRRLCAEHLVEWFLSFTQRAIDKYKMFDPEDRVLVAVSGGKDSLALWDVLLKLGYLAEGLYIGLGIDEGLGYSATSLEMCRRFVSDHHPEAVLHVVDLAEEHGQTVPELARTRLRGQGKPCSVCGLVKRHVMNRVAVSGNFTAIATGHNLDDEVAVLLQNTLHWQTGYLARQSPVLAEKDGLARKVKPFIRFYERETAAYTLVSGIDYIYDECPFATGATTGYTKELLNELELRSPGSKQQFYLEFLRARDAGKAVFAERASTELHPCVHCGQPTTAGDMCAFCRLWE
jgi:uncharacterized protein (TIGR00269 family)